MRKSKTGKLVFIVLSIIFLTSCTMTISFCSPTTIYNIYNIQKTVYGTNEYLSVRKGPGTEYDEIDRLYNGDTVFLNGESNGSWRKVLVNGKEGWVHNKYLK